MIDSNSGGTTSIVVTGSFFKNGSTVAFIPNSGSTVNADSVTFNNSGQLTAVVTDSNFVNANEPYDVDYKSIWYIYQLLLENVINVDTGQFQLLQMLAL